MIIRNTLSWEIINGNCIIENTMHPVPKIPFKNIKLIKKFHLNETNQPQTFFCLTSLWKYSQGCIQNLPPDVLYKKAALKNFIIFTGKLLCWSLFLIKLQVSQIFSCEKCEIFKNNYFKEHLWTAASVAFYIWPYDLPPNYLPLSYQ